ncbi:transfer complex protein TrsK-like protein (plasmid) [Gloeothece citriformis PCC 7424]|uniref:Transfer complex protein TrsK-like protein n=1 Tax=Gloeothece citriformis (strain PCC 7424) TaxID=65393 RepID=B7KLU0_GLOC7|nr:TraM recognition domain-containing protein [Gloeothece citriformis]ACK73762.1 transfer complex protein TrsK-like protein [Gloeothece citriformis PCC 7424]ACK74028.1 transfer complex protein TrsK-like protein [Gloeothece citriformis PCC 7424]
MSYYTAQTNTPNIPTSSITNFINTPSGLALLGSVAAFGLLSLIDNGGNKKAKLATSYWGGGGEKRKAAQRARKQLENPKRNSAALYLGMPDEVLQKLQYQWTIDKRFVFCKRKPSPKPFYVPDVQRGVSVLGGAGSGKTFSVIDPLIRSALDQGFPTIIYDFKYPAQTSRAVAYALKRGYKIRVFAPGFEESDSCNILSFLKDAEDAVAAGQLAHTITKNCDLGNGGKGDKFFEDAGATLVEGVFLLTKAIAQMRGKQYADLMTSSAILSLPKLGLRLLHAQQQNKFPIWTMRPLDQIMSVSGSSETESSIVGTAQRTFQKFIKRDYIGAFCGKSTLPLDLDGKTLIIFGLDRNNRDIVGPLLAATLHMVVSRNVSRIEPRKDPLCVFLDELPTIFLPQLQNWFNEAREDGFCGVIAAQNLGQLERIYGKELARIIFGGTACKFLFNPQDPESAKYFSEFLGDVEVKYDSKSRSKNTGKHGDGGSRSTSDNRQKRPLFEPAQFLKLSTGKAVVINPAYSRGDEDYVPIKQKIRVARCEIQEMEWSVARWPKIRAALKNDRKSNIDDDIRRKQFEERLALVNELFPEPPNNDSNSNGKGGNQSNQKQTTKEENSFNFNENRSQSKKTSDSIKSFANFTT